MRFILFTIGLILFSCSSEPTNYEYNDYLSDVYLYENSIDQYHETDSLTILYSFVGNKVTQQHGGIISMNIHVYQNDSILSGAINIDGFEDDKPFLKTHLETVNFPISIITRSVYRIEFEMKIESSYHFIVQSVDESFEDFEIDFSYPSKRF